MQAISARISSIVHATEDREKVIHALNGVCGLELSSDMIEQRAVRGHFGNPIVPLAVDLQGAQAEAVLVNIWRKFSLQEKQLLITGLADRLDDDGRLHLRLDKQGGLRGNVHLNDRDPIKAQFSFGRGSTYSEVENLLESLLPEGSSRPRAL